MDPCAYLSKWSCYALGVDKRAGFLLWIRSLMWDSEASGWFQSSGYRMKVFTGANRSCGCAVSVTMTVVSSTAPFLWPVCRNARKHFLDYVLGVFNLFSVQLEAHYSAQCRVITGLFLKLFISLWPMTRLVGCRVGLLKTVSLC